MYSVVIKMILVYHFTAVITIEQKRIKPFREFVSYGQYTRT